MPINPIGKGSLPTNGTGGRIRVEIKPVGNWEQTIRVIQKMGPAIKAVSIDAQTKVAKEILKKVRGHLRDQDLKWRPLNPLYAKQKASRGLDSRTLIAHGSYYHALEIWKSTWNGHMVFVGVKKGKYGTSLSGKKSKLDISTIAAIHEFSSGRKIPRRPLWNPTLKEMGGQKGLKELYMNYLLSGLKRKGIPVTRIRKLF